MTAVWTSANGRLSDFPLAAAWLERADAISATGAGDAAGQRRVVIDSFTALGNAFKALNLHPMSVPAWSEAWATAYGPGTGPKITPVPIFPAGSRSLGRNGVLVEQTARTYDTIHPPVVILGMQTGGREAANTDLLVRAWIDPSGTARFNCLDISAGSGECDLVGGLYKGRAPLLATSENHPYDGAQGAGPTDWRYVSWSDAPLSRMILAPPLTESVAIVGRAARAMRALGGANIAGQAMYTGTPPSGIPEPDEFTRDAAPPPPERKPLVLNTSTPLDKITSNVRAANVINQFKTPGPVVTPQRTPPPTPLSDEQCASDFDAFWTANGVEYATKALARQAFVAASPGCAGWAARTPLPAPTTMSEEQCSAAWSAWLPLNTPSEAPRLVPLTADEIAQRTAHKLAAFAAVYPACNAWVNAQLAALPPPQQAPDCTLPENPEYLIQEATWPGQPTRMIDRYFDSLTNRTAWIAAHLNCPTPPEFQGPGSATQDPTFAPPSPYLPPPPQLDTLTTTERVVSVPAVPSKMSGRTIALAAAGVLVLGGVAWYAFAPRKPL